MMSPEGFENQKASIVNRITSSILLIITNKLLRFGKTHGILPLENLFYEDNRYGDMRSIDEPLRHKVIEEVEVRLNRSSWQLDCFKFRSAFDAWEIEISPGKKSS